MGAINELDTGDADCPDRAEYDRHRQGGTQTAWCRRHGEYAEINKIRVRIVGETTGLKSLAGPTCSARVNRARDCFAT